jgi:hypothetical protein
MLFGSVDVLAGWKKSVSRDLLGTSTEHQVDESIGYTPTAELVIATENSTSELVPQIVRFSGQPHAWT